MNEQEPIVKLTKEDADAFSLSLIESMARDEISKRIWQHYDHAREKHPQFCHRLLPDWNAAELEEVISANLAKQRDRIERGCEYGNLTFREILDCEVSEAEEAMVNGNRAAAIEECYDAIAVLLRTIDVLNGRNNTTAARPQEQEAAQ